MTDQTTTEPIPTTTQTVTNRHALAYVGVILATVLLGSFGQQLAAGHVPIPPEWSWLTPVLLAGIVSLTTLLPRVTDTAENSLAQVVQASTAPPPAPVPSTPTEHVVTLRVAPTDAPSAKVIDVAPAPSPSPEPPATADRPASPPSA